MDIYISNPVTKLHLFEAEAIMRALAKYFNEDEEAWGIIGLLHDIDWDLTKDNQKEHCVKTQEILRKAGANDFLIETVISHGYANEMIPEFLSRQRSSRIQHSLVAAETLTGLIIASALIQPDKKLASVKPESLKKKFKNKAFAANCKRELILECEKASIPLDEFLNIGLKALQEISGKLGL
ncbi:MAG: HDIG domain-containing protein [bacterium]|nr:HDIG domain-containing protein [bacterium]